LSCVSGTYLSGSSCISCSVGKYSQAGASSCSTCAFGKVQLNVKSSSCITCVSGTSNAAFTKCISSQSCSSLAWTNAADYGSSSICGSSGLGIAGACSGLMNWANAKSYCEAPGGRLCTLSELQNDEARATGCIYDTELMWSSTACPSGFWLGMGGTSGGTATLCSAVSAVVNVRCCADVY
jgi:hypothetical protein